MTTDQASAVLDPHAPPTSTDQLMMAVASGDRLAFGELYDRLAMRVWGLARAILLNSAMAEEVCQDVFTTVWTEAGRYDPARGSAASWILLTTRSAAIDQVRHTQRSRVRDTHYAVTGGDHQLRDEVDDAVTLRSDHDEVRAALSALTPLQHQAISLAFYQGHTYAEIAALLGVPLCTIKSRIRDGLIKLQVHLTAAAARAAR